MDKTNKVDARKAIRDAEIAIIEELNELYESNRKKDFEITSFEHIKKELEEEIKELTSEEFISNKNKTDLYLMFLLGAIVGGFVIYLVV